MGKMDESSNPGDGPFYERALKNPVYWWNRAEKFQVAADVLWKSGHMDGADKFLGYGGSFSLMVAFDDGLFGMMCGLSIELMLKACILGSEKSVPESHKLPTLADLCSFKFNEYEDYSHILTEYIIWYGRYPTPKRRYNHFGIVNKIKGAWETIFHLGRQVPPKSGTFLERNIIKTRPECEIDWENFATLTKRIRVHYQGIRENHLRKGGKMAF